MRTSEKKFICDIVSIILAISVLACTVLVFVDFGRFHGVMPMIFGCGAAMFLALYIRNYLGNKKGRKRIHAVLVLVLIIFTAVSLLFPA